MTPDQFTVWLRQLRESQDHLRQLLDETADERGLPPDTPPEPAPPS